MTPDRLNAIVFGGFAGIALLISVVGVAGVPAFSVSGRTREFGIPLALGAPPRGLLSDVLREGLAIAALGVGAGILLALTLPRATGTYVAKVKMPSMLAFVGSGAVTFVAATLRPQSRLPERRVSTLWKPAGPVVGYSICGG